MGEVTKIEWCDHTFNPWIGCTKVSPGCDNCYAEALMDHRYKRVKWGPHGERSRTSESNWQSPRAWDRWASEKGRRPFVFCASLADVFDNQAPEEWRADLFKLARETPNLVWLFLTKRIGNAVAMSKSAGGFPRNAAIGSTFPNQTDYDRDITNLRHAKECLNALFSFGSFEPLLSSIDGGGRLPDWVIVGGESGKTPRQMDLEWARSLKRQAEAQGVIFNFKQTGGRDKGEHTLDSQTYFNRPSVAA